MPELSTRDQVKDLLDYDFHYLYTQDDPDDERVFILENRTIGGVPLSAIKYKITVEPYIDTYTTQETTHEAK